MKTCEYEGYPDEETGHYLGVDAVDELVTQALAHGGYRGVPRRLVLKHNTLRPYHALTAFHNPVTPPQESEKGFKTP